MDYSEAKGTKILDEKCVVCQTPLQKDEWIVHTNHNGIIGPGGYYKTNYQDSRIYCPKCGLIYYYPPTQSITTNK